MVPPFSGQANANSGTTTNNSYGYSISLSGSTATVSLSTTGATEAEAQTLIDNLDYENTSDDPTMADRVATLTSIKDSGGTANSGVDTSALSIASTVSMTDVNDGPTLIATAVNPIFTEGGGTRYLYPARG